MATRHMCTHTTTSARCAHKHRGDRVVTAPRRVPLSCCLARGCQWQRGSSVCATAPPLAAPPSLLRRRSSLPGARDGTTSTGRHVRPHLPHVRPRARRLRAQKAEEREGLPGSSSGRYEWLASGFADVRRLSLAFACPPHTHGSTPPGRSRSHLKHPLLQVGGWVVAVDARAQHDMRRLQWIAMGLEEALGRSVAAHWADGALEADLRLADLRARRRAMEVPLPTLPTLLTLCTMVGSAGRVGHTAMKLRIVTVRVWHGRQKMDLERGTNPTLPRRTCTCEYGLPSCRGTSAGVAKRPRRSSTPKSHSYDSQLFSSLCASRRVGTRAQTRS
jgi:hypothetical protein